MISKQFGRHEGIGHGSTEEGPCFGRTNKAELAFLVQKSLIFPVMIRLAAPIVDDGTFHRDIRRRRLGPGLPFLPKQ